MKDSFDSQGLVHQPRQAPPVGHSLRTPRGMAWRRLGRSVAVPQEVYVAGGARDARSIGALRVTVDARASRPAFLRGNGLAIGPHHVRHPANRTVAPAVAERF